MGGGRLKAIPRRARCGGQTARECGGVSRFVTWMGALRPSAKRRWRDVGVAGQSRFNVADAA